MNHDAQQEKENEYELVEGQAPAYLDEEVSDERGNQSTGRGSDFD